MSSVYDDIMGVKSAEQAGTVADVATKPETVQEAATPTETVQEASTSGGTVQGAATPSVTVQAAATEGAAASNGKNEVNGPGGKTPGTVTPMGAVAGNLGAKSAITNVAPVTKQTLAGGGKSGAPEGPKTFKELFMALSPDNKPMTDAEKAAEAKKQKREKLFAGISDAMMALSNAFYNNGVKYDPRTSLSAVSQARWDRIQKEREDKQRAYAEGMARAIQLDNQRSDAERNWQRQLELQAKSEQRADAKEERENLKLELKAQYDQAKLEFERAKWLGNHELAQRKAEEMERYHREYLAVLSQKKGRGRGSGSGDGYEYYEAVDKDGKVHKFKQYKAYEQFCMNNGLWGFDETENTTKSETEKGNGYSTQTSTTTKTTKKKTGHYVPPASSGSGKGSGSKSGGNTGKGLTKEQQDLL